MEEFKKKAIDLINGTKGQKKLVEYIYRGFPLLAANILRVARMAVMARSVTSFKCTALVTKHTNMQTCTFTCIEILTEPTIAEN